ncbi:MAG TPA: DegT/DnrJ/EryC1/StrS family aminotransferase [Acidobacteriota bacterium]|nr:DegT/DnrJ/EryC1/StrS family aminotransferase [Acidobacteriota bacterium]
MVESAFHRSGIVRRKFLGALGALGVAGAFRGVPSLGGVRRGASLAPGKLAIDGGDPIRQSPLQTRLCGPQFYDEAEKKELLEVLESRSPFRWWGSRETPPTKVRAFEEEYASHIGVKHALGVTSGTTALVTAMAALEVGPGDEVILPAWTWYACYDAVVLSGALPVFAEIDESFNIDPEDVEKRITPRTKVLMTVHLQGCPCDMEPLVAIARKHGLRVLEDCAQSVGGGYKKQFVGSIGDIGIYSFQVNKTITAGEGGAVVTNDSTLFERAMRFHDVGVLREPYSSMLNGGVLQAFTSCNFRMSEFTGAVMRAQLRKLDTICTRLRKNSRYVREGISDLPGLKFRKSPDLEGDLGLGVFIDLETSERQNRFRKAMEAENVPASSPSGSANLPIAPHIMKKSTVDPAWPSFTSPEGQKIQYGPETCPRTTDILGRFAGVMIDPLYDSKDLEDIVQAIRKVYPALS